MMQNIDFPEGYAINQLSKDNNSIVWNLCNKASDYFILSGGQLPSKDDMDNIFTDLPPNKTLTDKFVFGVYRSNKLIGIIDIIRNFPTIGVWTIGVLLLDPEERGKGLGTVIHQSLVKWAKKLGAKKFRIGVIEENYKAYKFWIKLGYTKTESKKTNIVSKNQVVNIMMRKL